MPISCEMRRALGVFVVHQVQDALAVNAVFMSSLLLWCGERRRLCTIKAKAAHGKRGVQLAADVMMLSGWWFKPEYIINELNINAAITSPAHDEVVALRPQPYTVRGYAYTGSFWHWSDLLGLPGNLACSLPGGSWRATVRCQAPLWL